MFQLKYTEEADKDLQAIFNRIAADSKENAIKYLGKIEECILRLRDFPKLGNVCKYTELMYLGIRVFPFDNYLIFYTINDKEQTINILHVLHGSVNYRNLF